MVQDSRSLLIQQLFQGGFKEDDDDDDDEDEDEAYELMKYQPSDSGDGGSGDKHQGIESKEHSHQELIFGNWKAKERNSKGSKDYATKKKVFDNNVVSKHKLLGNTTPWKDPQIEPHSGERDCLQSEREIIEEGSKKLLQIHNDFLIHQHDPPSQSFQETVQQKLENFEDSNCFPNDCYNPHEKGGKTLNPSLNFPTSKLAINNKENNGCIVLKEAQQSYGFVEDKLLSTQRDFPSLVSLEEEEQRQRCFVALNNTKVVARELNANNSIPIFTTRFEKKTSIISECTKSLDNDRGFINDSINSGDDVIHDVTFVEKDFKIDEQKEDQFSTEKRDISEASHQISKVEEVVQQIESIVSVIQMETIQSKINEGSKTIEKIKDWQIETNVEFRQAKVENPFSHVFERTHVELLSKVQEIEPTSLLNFERAKQIDEAGTFKPSTKDTIDARDKITHGLEESQLIEMAVKQCANATSLEEANRGNDLIIVVDNNKDKDETFVISSSMASPKELLVDTANHNTICLFDKENDSVMLTSYEGKLPSPTKQDIESPLNEEPTHMDSSLQKIPRLQAFKKDFTLDNFEANITPTTTSLQIMEMPTMCVSPHAIAISMNKRNKSHEKARTSKMSQKKKRVCMQHEDVRTMGGSMRSDIGVAYNNGPQFSTNIDHSLTQEISQHYAITNIINNPSLYDIVDSPQTIQAAIPFISHKTNIHLKQAQISAKEAMVVATSGLAQSHRKQSWRQTDVDNSHLKVAQESQISAITASVAAAAVVAKVAMEAAKAIQEASKEFFGQLLGSSQPSIEKSRFASSSEMFAVGQSNIAKITNCQHVQFFNSSKINTTKKIRKNQKFGALSTSSKDELESSRSKEKTIRFMKQEVVAGDKKVEGEGVCKKRTIHKMEKTQPVDFLPLSQVEARDPRCEVFKCSTGESIGFEPNELVEVMTGEVGLQGGWFVAKVLMKTDMEAFVQYKELFRADGCTPFRNLFPLSSCRQEDAYGRIQQGDWRWLRPLHPFNKVWKLCRGSLLPQTWTVGDYVDTYSNGGWWEGIVVEIDKADETNVRIHFSGGKGIQVVKAWDVRPSLIWEGDHWRPWKEKSTIKDEPSSKRLKLNVGGNWKPKSEESSKKEKMQSLKKLVEDTSCKSISDVVVGRQQGVCHQQKNKSGNKELNALNIRRMDLTPTNMGHKCKQVSRLSRSTRVVHPNTRMGSLRATLKKTISCSTPSPTLLATKKGIVSTRLQLKIEAEKRKKMSNSVISKVKVIQKGAKSISTQNGTMNLKSKTIQTKLLNALKNTCNRKLPLVNQKLHVK